MPVALAAAALGALVVAESATKRRRALTGPVEFVGGADKVQADPKTLVGPIVSSGGKVREYTEEVLRAACDFLPFPGCSYAGESILSLAFNEDSRVYRASLRAGNALNKAINGDVDDVARHSKDNLQSPVEDVFIRFKNGCSPIKGCPGWEKCGKGTVDMRRFLPGLGSDGCLSGKTGGLLDRIF